MTRPRILVADKIAQEGLDVLAQGGEVLVETGQSEDELVELVGDVQAIVVRSATRITARIIEAAKQLRIIARAGVGVDNIDVEAATRLGVLVVNSPAGNTLAAAEFTMAMLLAAARNIPQAYVAMRSGSWDRSKFLGRQVFGKTLGIVGFGRIGREVAARARAMGMRLLAFDPFVADEPIEAAGASPVDLPTLLGESDFVTLHARLTPQTEGMIGAEELKQMKPTALLINCARGALVQEEALVQALQEGWIAGAALDVFRDDKHPSPELLAMDQVVVTPHLGASAEEAQVQVAVDVAEQVVDVLQGRPARSPVNAPALPPEQREELAQYLALAQALGKLAAATADAAATTLAVAAGDEVSDEHLSLLARYAVADYLHTATGRPVNYVNAPIAAADHGLEIATVRGQGPEGYSHWLTLSLRSDGEERSISGALVGAGPPRLVNLFGFAVEVPTRGLTLILWHGKPGQPGFIGTIGTLLGRGGISITGIEVGLEAIEGVGVMLVQVAQPLGPEILEEVRSLPGVLKTALVDFGGGAG